MHNGRRPKVIKYLCEVCGRVCEPDELDDHAQTHLGYAAVGFEYVPGWDE